MPVRYPATDPPWLRPVAIGGALFVLLGAVALVTRPTAEPAAAADERTAIALLRSLRSAEGHFAEALWVDTDRDGRGEFGFLGELAGSARLRLDGLGRLGAALLPEPLLPLSFALVRDKTADHGAYLVQVFLPGADGSWAAEADDGGGAGVMIACDAAEEHFRAYAWPAAGSHARRAFYIDETGAVRAFATGDRRFEGHDRPLPAGAIDDTALAWTAVK